ncbi:MAG: hypothetical protein K8R91_00715 [Phycisphaerae bacterium]|nr:hypothetical protein [Phycisphaerae bacterium]
MRRSIGKVITPSEPAQVITARWVRMAGFVATQTDAGEGMATMLTVFISIPSWLYNE